MKSTTNILSLPYVKSAACNAWPSHVECTPYKLSLPNVKLAHSDVGLPNIESTTYKLSVPDDVSVPSNVTT